MLMLISYDVSTESPGGTKRLRRIARACQDYGQRVQFSVFECLVTQEQWVVLRQRLLDEMDPKLDSLRFYALGNNWHHRVEHIGAKPAYDPQGPLLF
ncbi:MAG: CRISPR-associated endonuclease Cas2 [Magnetococcales bacterium]|nr:CRISPR-associated endonuclease Cas2 [Magnetococcales bacterium]